MKEPKKIKLANIPTPIQKMNFKGCKFLIKRDDFTGVELSGNKVRKLEYLLYEAKKQKSDYVFTSGGDQSNHARATCIAASAIGIKSKLFLWGNRNQKPNGNLFLDKLTGSDIVFLTRKEFNDVSQIMLETQLKLKEQKSNSYIIPSGGSSALGIWGYINFVKELTDQINLKKVKGIVLAAGSGGTAAGILVGCALLGINLQVFIVNVLSLKDEIYSEVNRLTKECINDFNLNIKVDLTQMEVLDGYSEEGYKNITPEKISLIKSFFQDTGILLDPTYTGKAFIAYYENFLKSQKKTNVLFLHTGGIFGAFSKKKIYLD